jgi:hypothetical protein
LTIEVVVKHEREPIMHLYGLWYMYPARCATAGVQQWYIVVLAYDRIRVSPGDRSMPALVLAVGQPRQHAGCGASTWEAAMMAQQWCGVVPARGTDSVSGLYHPSVRTGVLLPQGHLH